MVVALCRLIASMHAHVSPGDVISLCSSCLVEYYEWCFSRYWQRLLRHVRRVERICVSCWWCLFVVSCVAVLEGLGLFLLCSTSSPVCLCGKMSSSLGCRPAVLESSRVPDSRGPVSSWRFVCRLCGLHLLLRSLAACALCSLRLSAVMFYRCCCFVSRFWSGLLVLVSCACLSRVVERGSCYVR